MTLFHVTDGEAANKIQAEGLSPSVGPRSAKFGEKSEAIYFFRSREFAYDAVCGWLGEEFPETEELYCLEVVVSDEFPLQYDPNFGEVEASSAEPIPAGCVVSCQVL